MKKLSKLLMLMLLAGTVVFFNCNGDDDPEPDPKPSDLTIELDNVSNVIASSDKDITVPLTVSCVSPDELLGITATVYDGAKGVIRNIVMNDMDVTTVSAQKWNVNIAFPYEKDVKKVEVTVTTKNKGEKTADFQVTHGSAGMKIKVKFTSWYDKDFNPTNELKTTEWEFGWANMEVGVKPGNTPRIGDAIYITACRNPEGAAETYDDYDALARSDHESLPHRFMLFTYVTDERTMSADVVKDEEGVEHTNLKVQYLEGDYFMHGISQTGDYPSFDWDVYTKGLDAGANSTFKLTDFNRREMVISGYCEIEFFNMHQLTQNIVEENASKAKVRIDFTDLKLNTVENPWWSTVYQMPLRED